MVSVSVDVIRLFLHILAATVWVGGQITLGALVPVLRGFDGAPKLAARRFAAISWTAYAVLVATGIWNMIAIDAQGSVQTTLNVKMGVVLLSGVAAFVHSRATSKAGMAVWGAVTALTALAALLLGVMIAEAA